jgi:Arabinogalactan endo-1,4-beta-galactosidase
VFKKCCILFLSLAMIAMSYTGYISPLQIKVASAAAVSSNLLANPGFEDDSAITTTPIGWKTITTGGTVTTRNPGYEGSYSASVTSTSKTGSFNAPAAGIYQTFTGLEQGTYTFQAWIKTNAYSPGDTNTSAYLEAKDTGAPTMRSYVNIYPNANDWVLVVMRNVISYNGKATIGLYLQNAVAGMSVSIDNASFTLELSDDNPVQNWGFENDLSGWTPSGDVAIQTLEADSGSKVLKLAAGAKVEQNVALKPNSSYIASVRGKVDSGGLVKIGVSGIANARSAPSATSAYSLLTVGFATSASETQGTIYLENTGAVPAYVDSVDLFELDNTIIKGVDISYLPLVEDYNGHYSANGVRQDFFDIMQNRGVNTVMAMVFVEAGNVVGGEYTMHKGYFDKSHTIELAQRAKAHHMKLIPSFHYSDGWISSGKAFKPEAWLNQSLSQLQTTMYNYNYDFLKSMVDAGVEPDIVKIGNEENSGILWPDGKVWSTGRDGFAAVINAAYQAMKDVSPAMRGMLHVNNGYDPASTNSWFNGNTSAGITWDSQGYSLYGGRPTGSIYNMMTNNLAKWPDKDVLFVETGFSTGSGNSIGNSYYEKSERGQYNWLIDYMQALRDSPNPTDQKAGFFYWAAEWITEGDGYDGPNSPLLPGGTSTSWPGSVGDRTLFTNNGNALDGTYAYLWRGKAISKPLGGELAFSDNSASYAVTPSGVTGVTMNDKSITIVKGKYKQLVATVAPADKATNSNLIWISSNPSVATVNSAGIVTGVGTGNATITVQTEEGSFTDISTVTVTPNTLAGSIILTDSQLSGGSMSLIVDQQSKLKVVLPPDATNKVVKLTSSDPSVLRFLGEPVQTDQPGTLYQQTDVTPEVTLIAKRDGTSTVTVTAMDGSVSQSFVVTVTKIPVDSVTLDATNVNLELNRTKQLNATVSPSNASFQSLKWTSSDEAVATVSGTGLVTAIGLGNTTITVTTDDGAKTEQALVTVSDVHTASIALNKSTLRLRVGDMETLVATVLPEDAKDKTLDWVTADSSVATVTGDGIVTAVSNGITTLTVSAQDGAAAPVTIPITIADVLNVTGVTLTPSSITLEAGNTTVLSAQALPANADNTKVSWSTSDESVAVVDQNGLVTTLKPGSATITATTEDGGYAATSTVVVINLLSQGKVVKASKVSSDAAAAAANAVDGNNATTWYPGGYTFGSNITVDLGQTAVIESTLVNTWNQENFTVSVSEDGTNFTTLITHGEIVASANGTVATTITNDTLPANTYARYVKLTMNEVMKKNGTSQQWTGVNEFKVFGRFVAPVQTITLKNVPSSIVTSDSTLLTAEVTPLNADPRLTWSSSNTNAITIDQTGKVTAALLDGVQGDIADSSELSLTAKSGVKATANIGVKIPIIVESIGIYSNDASIQDDRLDLAQGQKAHLQASIFQGQADYKSVAWSSDNPEVATIDEATGEITAIGQGTAKIKLKVDSYKDLPGGMEFSTDIDVHVVNITAAPNNLNAIAKNSSSVDINWGAVEDSDGYNIYRSEDADGTYIKLNAVVLKGTSYTDSGLIASSTYYYKVTAVNLAGESQESEAVSAVTNEALPIDVAVTGVTVSPATVTLTEGENMELTALVAPQAATNKDVSWNSSDTDVAEVSESGMVTAKEAGTATITVTTSDGLFTANSLITVEEASTTNVDVTGVSVTPAELTLTEGGSSQLTALVVPLDATNHEVSWSSSDTAVATVSASGSVTAKQAGIATITVTTSDGLFTANSLITVEEAPTTNVDVTGVSISPATLILTEGGNSELTAVIAPLDATNQEVSWSSSDTDVVEVSESGMVTAKKAGTATITVTTVKGAFTATSTVTVQAQSAGGGNNDNPSPGTSSAVKVDPEGKLSALVTPDSQGVASVTIGQQDLNKAIDRMKGGKLDITIQSNTSIEEIQVLIPVDQLNVQGNNHVNRITINAGNATVSFSTNLLQSSNNTADGNLQLTVKSVELSKLPEVLANELGSSAQVYDFTLSIDGRKITAFQPHDQLEVTLDYTLMPGENPKQVIVYYISDNGTLEVVKNGKYDEKSGKVIFKPTHFSQYSAAYSSIRFSDLAGVSWAVDAIQALAARNVIKGYEDGSFKPVAAVTRAEFITMLTNALDLVDTTAISHFSDVTAGAWYSSSIASAQKLGIIKGKLNNSFGVNDMITRQEMAVMAYRVLEHLELKLIDGTGTIPFADQTQIAGYAKEAVATLKQWGLISGFGSNLFGPNLSTTRAEAAMLINNLLEQIQ